MDEADLTHKVHRAIVGHDLAEIVDVLMRVLGIAIRDECENAEDRLDKIMAVHCHLLSKSLLDDRS